MSIAKWDDSYRTGYTPVDDQHKQLFGMVNELHDAIVSGKGTNILAPTLEQLAKYAVEHFAEEEKLMASIGYPNMGAHKAKHDDLTRQVHELLAKFQQGKLVLSMTISTFLANWLKHHVKEDDVTLIAYVKRHPVSQKTVGAAH